MFYCSEHGHNTTHATADCYTLKNRTKAGAPNGDNRKFSNKSFRKEINLLAKLSSKKKVLDMYATVVKREQAKLLKRSSKRKTRAKTSATASDSDSDTNTLLNNMDVIAAKPNKKKAKNVSNVVPTKGTGSSSTSPEEAAYMKKVLWLKDHGEEDVDEDISSNTDN
jgi:hypothetical protein